MLLISWEMSSLLLRMAPPALPPPRPVQEVEGLTVSPGRGFVDTRTHGLSLLCKAETHGHHHTLRPGAGAASSSEPPEAAWLQGRPFLDKALRGARGGSCRDPLRISRCPRPRERRSMIGGNGHKGLWWLLTAATSFTQKIRVRHSVE